MLPVVLATVAVVVIGSSVPQQAPPRDPVRPKVEKAAPAAVTPEVKNKIAELRKQASEQQAAGNFEGTIAALEAAAQLDAANPQGHQLVATYYWEKVQKDKALTPAQRDTYLHEGIAATDRALSLNPDYPEALTYKNILLRMQGNATSDAAEKARLFAEADALRNRAIALQRERGSAASQSGAFGPPPPPPPPPPTVDGVTPVRVGGNIKPPTKVKDVRPIYPADAQAERVQGVVIIEATIDTTGVVSDAKVLRSIPMLDEAALAAVRQWEFTPTVVNNIAVPVIMTVTVNFTLDK